ncbi:MAG: hypothetical protein CMN55_01380 [Sneathiella sp.]|jgi:TRAP-type C4-dicarboxylate transport system substrate-binding protein|uniref:C4-dicarboxylate TRAP transporter substrate-binding protein n=1 Tax=Sneathiella sp. TaxID=1964365 RepID=UPI000C54E86B|nr:C4-dicarboxylate TRAP transporter substrate-binding protein [Sneathiella sp.]MAL77757.1 hypothetical protein [Sneathiella sp.]
MKIKNMIAKRFMMIVTLFLLCAFGTNAYAEYNIRFSELGPPRGARAEAIQWWASEIEKRTNGEVKVEFFWSQSLTKGKDTLRAVGTGLADAGTIMGIYNPAEVPVWSYGNLPFVSGDSWVALRTWHELKETMPELQEEMKNNNVRILINYTTGPSDLISKFPIKSADDIKGKKIRATGAYMNLISNLGAVPVNTGFGEVYQAMDRGTVDGAAIYLFAAHAYKLYEVGSYITEVNMGQVPGYGAGINLDLWESMPENIRQTITEVSNEFADYYGELLIKDIDDSRAEMQAGIDGKVVEVSVLDEAEREKWKEAANEFIVDWKKRVSEKGLDPQSIIDQVNATTAKYEKELEEKGYPWTRK